MITDNIENLVYKIHQLSQEMRHGEIQKLLEQIRDEAHVYFDQGLGHVLAVLRTQGKITAKQQTEIQGTFRANVIPADAIKK